MLLDSCHTLAGLVKDICLAKYHMAQAVTPYTGGFPELGPPLVHSSNVDQRFKEALTAAKMILAGAYLCSHDPVSLFRKSSLVYLGN